MAPDRSPVARYAHSDRVIEDIFNDTSYGAHGLFGNSSFEFIGSCRNRITESDTKRLPPYSHQYATRVTPLGATTLPPLCATTFDISLAPHSHHSK